MSDDRAIWQAYAKGVKRTGPKKPQRKIALPLREGRACAASAGRGEVVDPSPAKAKDLLRTPKLLQPLPQGERKTTFDRRMERALRQGEIPIDAKLDLHGLIQVEAFTALEKFVSAQVKRGHRRLLVVTGKGSGGAGVLRANLPQWLESLSTAVHILDLRPAAPKHGGEGAFYVILKRRRD